MKPKQGDTIAVWFSCGAASAVAAQKTIELYGDICTIRIINNPIKEEHEDNQRFLKDVEKWLSVDIEIAVNPKYPDASCVDVWDKRQYMSGVGGAPCTFELKKKARQEWEKNNHHDWLVLGFTAEEKKRHERFALNERSNILPILIDANITKGECYQIIQGAGIELPEIYKLGYPNANCIGCVKATGITYWNHVRRVHPDVWRERSFQSRAIGCKLVKYNGKRIYLDMLPPDAVGRPMKNMDFECGIFCDMK
jgi:3'-phosphoadenosine 5'-phosphosulfate sulfotransferase (PAPS reductase)/FAD synthetase